MGREVACDSRRRPRRHHPRRLGHVPRRYRPTEHTTAMTRTSSVTDPSDSREMIEAALKPWGWTCGPEFWNRYHSDPWVFNLVNALTRTTQVVAHTTAEVDRLRAKS